MEHIPPTPEEILLMTALCIASDKGYIPKNLVGKTDTIIKNILEKVFDQLEIEGKIPKKI